MKLAKEVGKDLRTLPSACRSAAIRLLELGFDIVDVKQNLVKFAELESKLYDRWYRKMVRAIQDWRIDPETYAYELAHRLDEKSVSPEHVITLVNRRLQKLKEGGHRPSRMLEQVKKHAAQYMAERKKFQKYAVPFILDLNYEGLYKTVQRAVLLLPDSQAGLDSGIKKYDSDAKTHLKIMPHLFSDDKIDHGIDMEALTKLSDIIGNDAKIVKKQWNHRKEKEYWEGVYSFDWKEVTMTYDFCRSVSPNKPNVNSESHYLSSSQYRNLYMTPDFVRSAYWLATLHGMNVNYTWFWAREKDGAIRKDLMNYRGPDNAMNNAYAASVVQQPRVANEVAKTMMDLNAFSSEIAAMQSLKQPIRLFYSKTSVINKWFHMQNLFDLYRKMYFNGVPLGFATEDIINSQKNNLWELIVVSKTEFVTDAEFNSIQKYLDNGGTVIIDSVSLKKNEYGQPRNISLNASKGKLIPMDGIGKITNEAFRILEQKKLTPDVFIVEKNGINTKGCMWRVVPTGNNKYVMSIINLGCTDATVTLKSKKGNIKNVVNLINGTSLGQQFTLTPEKTILIEIQK